MARYTALNALYVDGRYIEIGQTCGDEGNPADVPLPASYSPSPCLDPINQDAINKLTATFVGKLPTPTSPTQPGWGVLGYWGPRSQFQTLPLPPLSTAYKSIIHN
jgi:hypothetical protein